MIKLIISNSYETLKVYKDLKNSIYHPESTMGSYELAIFVRDKLKDFDGTIITCSEYLVNLIGAAIEYKILDYKKVKIFGLSPNKVKCTFESSYNEEGILIDWPIGFFGDHELLLGGNE